MTNQSGGFSAEHKSAAERIEEARQLNRSICETLSRVLAGLNAGDFGEIKDVTLKQKQLETALLGAQKLEADFNAKYGDGIQGEEIDFDRIRRDIGCRLARIRKCCRA